MKYVVVDLEMNPVAKEHKEERKICRNEIIEIGAVIIPGPAVNRIIPPAVEIKILPKLQQRSKRTIPAGGMM